MTNAPRYENTRTVAFAPTWWAPASSDLTRAVAELNARRGDVGAVALGVVVVDHNGCRARVVFGATAALTVGRHDATDVPLSRGDASLRHLVFARESTDVVAFDLASTHGSSAATSRAAENVPLIVAVGDTVVVACCVGAGVPFPALTPAMVRDAQPLRVRLVLPEMRAMPSSPSLSTRLSPTGTRADAWRAPHLAGQLPLMGLAQPLLIGRLPRNDLVIADDRVSRVHAVVLPAGARGHAVLVDVGSTNGTTVIRHGRPQALGVVARCAAIGAGDVVELGGVRLQVMGSADGADSAAIVYDGRPWRGGEA